MTCGHIVKYFEADLSVLVTAHRRRFEQS